METTTTITDNLSMIKQIALNLLKTIEEKIVNNECSDDDIMSAMSKLNAKASGYVKESELVTYDKAMQRLNIKNRNTFSNLCKKYHIKNVKINNMNVGFHISDIERLCLILNNN